MPAVPQSISVSTGIAQLDQLLDGLYLGDNVIWYDNAGSLAWVFCQNFLASCREHQRPLIYVTFDRSPKNLLSKLGPLADFSGLTILDCFTWGEGAGSDVFLQFYRRDDRDLPCRVEPLEQPRDMAAFSDTLYKLHGELQGIVGFIFESLTGMQKAWGGEEALVSFYSHACPRLYELNTVAYWVMEKEAHTSAARARINQIAQVIIDLAIRRGTTSLTVHKAENHPQEKLHQPSTYWTRDLEVRFEDRRRANGPLGLGGRLKALRSKRGLSQAELARLVGVTASNISQVESNLIYPSIPALTKVAEVLGVAVSYFFGPAATSGQRAVFPGSQATVRVLELIPGEAARAWSLLPPDQAASTEALVIEVAPGADLPTHFLINKGPELGYLLSGRLVLKFAEHSQDLAPGDLVHITSQAPTGWQNPEPESARLLWLTLPA